MRSFGLPATAVADPVELRNNPFSRPPSANLPAASEESQRPNRTALSPDLRATLVAANSKLADVGGRILRPGDEVDGFVLLQVFEDRAVFESRQRKITVLVKPELVEDDE